MVFRCVPRFRSSSRGTTPRAANSRWRLPAPAQFLVPALCILFAGCSTAPDSYPIPEQIAIQPAFRPYRVSRIIEMGPQGADRFIVSDILGSSGAWRWTGRRPTVKVGVRSTKNLQFQIDYAVADATFADTGPVHVTFWVGDHKIGEQQFDQPGEGHFTAPVPEDWVEPDSDVTLSAEVDKVWVAPTDGVELGLILTRMGLLQTEVPPEASVENDSAQDDSAESDSSEDPSQA